MHLREQILDSYDHHEGTRIEIAHRYGVSVGMVKKLLQQRRRTGDIAPRHHYSGRKPMILDSHCRQNGRAHHLATLALSFDLFFRVSAP
jgi:transposase